MATALYFAVNAEDSDEIACHVPAAFGAFGHGYSPSDGIPVMSHFVRVTMTVPSPIARAASTVIANAASH